VDQITRDEDDGEHSGGDAESAAVLLLTASLLTTADDTTPVDAAQEHETQSAPVNDIHTVRPPGYLDLELDAGTVTTCLEGGLHSFAHPRPGLHVLSCGRVEKVDHQVYFCNPQRDNGVEVLCVVITCYTEKSDEFGLTLRSLLKTDAIPGVAIKVLVVFDGVLNADGEPIIPQCTRDYLSRLYPVLVDGWSRFEDGGDLLQTTVVSSDLAVGEQSELRELLDARSDMEISLLIKRGNRTKGNSLEWGIVAFGKDMGCTYFYGTDVGTMYDRNCLNALVTSLKASHHTGGCTGTQRVLPMIVDFKNTNDNGEDTIDISFMSYFLRMLQVYEVEAQNPLSKAVSDQLGFLYVLSGPSACFVWKHLYERRHEIFGFINKPDAQCSGVELNLKLGEDRLPTTMTAFPKRRAASNESGEYTQSNLKTHWVRDSVHYWSPEKQPRGLVVQRGIRWVPSGVATYTWLLREKMPDILKSDHTCTMKLFVVTKLLVDFIGMIALALAPGLTTGVAWALTYRLLAQDYASADEVSDLTAPQDPIETQCVSCAAIFESGATDAFCEDTSLPCEDMVRAFPDHCRCV
jgi:hypothetical protein